MTAEDLEDPDGHLCTPQHIVRPRKWCWAFVPAILFNFWVNIFNCFRGVCAEFSEAFQAHGLYKMDRHVDKDVVSSFREQLKVL